MVYGVEVEGSTIKRLVDHTDVLYRLVSSYTVTATLTYSYSTVNIIFRVITDVELFNLLT